jgi:hypothetical protein
MDSINPQIVTEITLLSMHAEQINSQGANLRAQLIRTSKQVQIIIDRKRIGLASIERVFHLPTDLISMRKFNEMLAKGDILKSPAKADFNAAIAPH